MPTYQVKYVDGDEETLVVKSFALAEDGMWMDFYDARDAIVLRVRAEHILRIERTQDTPAASEEFHPEDEELAG